MASLGDHVVLEAFNEAVVGAATELMESVEEDRRVGLFEAHIYFSQGAGKLGSGFEFSPSEAEMVTTFDELFEQVTVRWTRSVGPGPLDRWRLKGG